MKAKSISQGIIEPYAEALMSLAQEQGKVDEFASDVQLILDTLQGSKELAQFLSVPVIKNSTKKQVIAEVFGGKVAPVVQNFMQLLVDRGRVFALEAMCRQYQQLVRVRNGVVLAEVTAAVPPNGAQEDALRQRVQAMTGANSVELSVVVDADLIGGVIIKVGSQVVDASIRGQLRRITNFLTAKA
ncbi:MAG: ATP synthase F1 subunit delta [Pseudanabaenaceae cyanobacterium]|jgi:F-type H+-transporting ATPase subunit delta